MSPDRVALILGATGGIGEETAVALDRHGWRIRALTRYPNSEAERREAFALLAERELSPFARFHFAGDGREHFSG